MVEPISSDTRQPSSFLPNQSILDSIDGPVGAWKGLNAYMLSLRALKTDESSVLNVPAVPRSSCLWPLVPGRSSAGVRAKSVR